MNSFNPTPTGRSSDQLRATREGMEESYAQARQDAMNRREWREARGGTLWQRLLRRLRRRRAVD